MPGASVSPAERVERVFQISLLLLVACGYFAIVSTGYLDLLSTLLMAVALILRLLHVSKVLRVEISRPIASGLALGFVGFYIVELYYFAPSLVAAFVPATLQLMFLFTALKLLIAKKERDYFYLGLLAFLQLLTASMFMAGLGYLIALMVFVALALTTYSCFEIKRGCASNARIVEDYQRSRRKKLGRRLAVLSTTLAVGILALSGAFFLILPRTPGNSPFPRLPGNYSIGFSKEVNLGATGFLNPNYTPVMRVESLSGDSLAGLKWRGLALRYFDGVRWSNPSAETTEVRGEKGIYGSSRTWRRSHAGRRIHYSVTLEPLSVDALFVAGLPQQIRGNFRKLEVSDDDSFLVKGIHPQPLRYEVESGVPERSSRRPDHLAHLSGSRKYLQLPKLDPLIPALALRIGGRDSAPLRQAEAIEHYLRSEFGYTLDLPARRRADPLAYFLFERREGHCEYFASAMTVMLRTLNIPARLVAGFSGGVYNSISGLYVIRSNDAHNWVEAYIPNYGWLSFDPTPPAPGGVADRWLAQYWMYWDALQSAWTGWVVDYDQSRQTSLAQALQERSRKTAWNLVLSVDNARQWLAGLWRKVAEPLGNESGAGRSNRLTAVAAIVAAVIAVLFSWVWVRPRLALWYRGRRLAAGWGSVADCSFLYRRAVRVLERRGFSRKAWQTAEEYAASISRADLRILLGQINEAYNAARFGRDNDAERRLPGLVRSLESAK